MGNVMARHANTSRPSGTHVSGQDGMSLSMGSSTKLAGTSMPFRRFANDSGSETAMERSVSEDERGWWVLIRVGYGEGCCKRR